MQTYTLFQLNEYIRRILALNFSEPLWITAEIAQINQSRGHFFLSLVEKEEEAGTIIAQSEAAIWEPARRQIRKQLGLHIHEILQAGRSVRLKVQVDYHERYGLKLIIHEIDPAYTLGQLELQRRQTITTLQKSGLIGLNAQLSLPLVVQRLAVISSETAAGYHDLVQQLAKNAYGYHFDLQLFPSAMQGQQVGVELPAQIKKINRRKQQFDAVVVIRGGGSRLDLSAFDELEVAKTLAKCKLPVITGIGHEIDETVADLVAHTRLKTPTAVAEWLIARHLQFESRLLQQAQQLQLISRQRMQEANSHLRSVQQTLLYLSQNKLQQQHQLLDYISAELPTRAQQQVRSNRQKLDHLDKMIHLLSIENTLERGFTLTKAGGKVISSGQALKKGDKITTVFRDGDVDSTVDI
ncbi:MAG: exodeoxyribonuclease VII large subunit [Lewinella sp.]|nr:exodeoxyribonuclease VII large subunit [Lewinella sp.]